MKKPTNTKHRKPQAQFRIWTRGTGMKELTYNVYKCAEGGIGGEGARQVALEFGANKVMKHPSIYVGQTAITVLATQRVHRKIERYLYH